MSRRSAARGSEAARSVRLAPRTSSIVAVSSARPSRWLSCCRGSRRPMSSPIAAATVTIPPTTSIDLVPAGRAGPYRWPTVAAQEVMGGKVERQLLLRDAPVRPQPGAQQRPDPLHRVDVDLAEPVAVLVA